MKLEVNKNNITNYIPQRYPFVMVDSIISQSKENAVSTFEITPENIFVTNNEFTESGLLENIAQTAAANVGVECQKNNIPVPLGFIGGINKVKLFKLPQANTVIQTEIKVLQEVFGITLIEGVVKSADEVLIQCQMKIMIKKDEVH